MLDQGVYRAARGCLFKYGGHTFKADKENSVEGGSSKVDYVMLVDDDKQVLCEVKSPSVMRGGGQLLPQHGIELTWFRGQSTIPKIFAKVSTPFLISYNTGFKKICIGRFVFRPETNPGRPASRAHDIAAVWLAVHTRLHNTAQPAPIGPPRALTGHCTVSL